MINNRIVSPTFFCGHLIFGEKSGSVFVFKVNASPLYKTSINVLNKGGELMYTQEAKNQAVLSNQGDMTSFRYADYNIRFRTPSILKKYVEVKSWDNGYIVVMADYEGMGITEEYIDLVPIHQNLYIKPETFLKNIQTVKIGDYEQ